MATRSPLKLTTNPAPRGPIKVRFSVRALEAIGAPASGRIWIYDDGAGSVPGLTLAVTATNARSFYWYRKVNGKPERVRIGGYDELSIDQARKRADDLNGQRAKGANPAEAKRRARRTADAATTFGSLFAEYMDKHAKPHKRTADGDQAQYDLHLTKWARKPLDAITRADVAAVHAKIGKDAPVSANRVLALLSGVFTYAIRAGYIETNPARDVTRFKEKTRERFMDASELPRWLKALDDEPGIMADYLIVTLLTGQRRRNVAAMRWDAIDLDRRVWTIPGDEYKTGSDTIVPLVDRVVAILKARQAAPLPDGDPRAPYVFPARSATAKLPYLSEPKAAMKSACTRAKIAPVRIHDLRRTLASWATMKGVPYPVVAAMIGHTPQGVTSIYARFDLEAVRKAFTTTAEAMLGTTTTEGGNQ
jgi:integrase